MENLWQRSKASIIAVAALAILAMSSVVIVPETQQVVVVRLGDPVRKINAFKRNQEFGGTGAGINWRIPFFEQLVWMDKRLMSFPMERQMVQSSDQLRLEVTAYARFRVIDPIKLVKTVGSTDRLTSQLQPIMTSVLRQELGKRTFQSLLNAERGAAMTQIKTNLDKQAREYGAQIIDVRIQRADLPAGALESAFARMQAAREQEATTIQAQGQKQAQLIRSDAQARATQVYADAFGKDPAFYDFYRAMQSYDATFSNQANPGSSTIILSPDNEYLRQFKGR